MYIKTWKYWKTMLTLSPWTNYAHYVSMDKLCSLCLHGQTMLTMSPWTNYAHSVSMDKLCSLCLHGQTMLTMSPWTNYAHSVSMDKLCSLCLHGHLLLPFPQLSVPIMTGVICIIKALENMKCYITSVTWWTCMSRPTWYLTPIHIAPSDVTWGKDEPLIVESS